MTIEDKNALNQEQAQAIFDYVKGLNLRWSNPDGQLQERPGGDFGHRA